MSPAPVEEGRLWAHARQKVAVTVVFALLLTALALTLPANTALELPSGWTLALLVLAAAVGEVSDVTIRHGKGKSTLALSEPAIVAALLLTPPWFVLALSCVTGMVFTQTDTVKHLLGKGTPFPAHLALKTTFNTASYVAAGATLVLAYHTISGVPAAQGVAADGTLSAVGLGGLVLGVLGHVAVNNTLVHWTLSHFPGSPDLEELKSKGVMVSAAGILSATLGALAVVVLKDAPVLLPLMLVAGGGLVHLYLRGLKGDQERARTAQLTALTDLISSQGESRDLTGSFLSLVRATFGVEVAYTIQDGPTPVVVESTEGGIRTRPASTEDRRLLTLPAHQLGYVLTDSEAPDGWSQALVVLTEGENSRAGAVVLASTTQARRLGERDLPLLSSLVSALVVAQRNASLSKHLEAITSSQGEAVIAVDESGTVTFLNPAAEELLGVQASDGLGHPYRLLFGLEQGGIPLDLQSVAVEGNVLQGDDGRLRRGEARVPVQYTVAPIQPASGETRHPGVVVALVDVTAQKQASLELQASQTQLVEFARTLQRSLLPPVLPDLPGAQVATRYHAGADGLDVGGDFYDVFETRGDTWAVVIGDVCGRGAEAAALTALTRHTFRAAAMGETSPAKLLGTLNEAILRDRRDDRFCTVAAAHLRLGTDPRIKVSCGGHPPPYLVRTDGTVSEVGPEGTLLGILSEIDVSEQETALQQGDVLVFYTDGVIEAKSPTGELYGEGTFEPLLSRCANLPAEEVALRIEESLQLFRNGPPDDDTAYVVLAIT